MKRKCQSLSCVNSLWPRGAVALQASLSIELSRQEYWHGLPFHFLGDLPDPGINPLSLALAGRFLSTVPQGKALCQFSNWVIWFVCLFSCRSSLYIRYMICKYFISFCSLPFSVDSVLWCTKALKFYLSYLFFFFYCLFFWCHIQGIIAKFNVIFSPMVSSRSFVYLGITFWSLIHIELIFT